MRRDGTCLPTGNSCWQRFAYEWDEVGQLARARRWDLTASPDERTNNAQLTQAAPTRAANAELRFGYDAGGTRVLRTALSPSGVQKHTVYMFSSLEARTTDFDASTSDYAVHETTASMRLGAGMAEARVVYEIDDVPNVSSGRQHVLFVMADRLGSTSFVFDRATSELVEAATYQSYGAPESDYRPARWASYREPHKFSGKEDDIEVGLAYFGARYLSTYLATWISADPVTVHDLGSDVNPYAYVHGTPLMGVDPDGRFAWFVFFAAIAVSAAVSAISNYVQQGEANGYNQINPLQVLGAAGVGAVVGAVSGGAGGLATAGVTAALNSAVGSTAAGVIGGVVGGAVGGAAGGATGYGLSGGGSWSGLGSAMTVGAVGGACGAGMGVAAGSVARTSSEFANALISGAAGASASYGAAVGVSGQKASWQQYALSLGAGVASAAVASAAASETTRAARASQAESEPPRLLRSQSGAPAPVSEGGGLPQTGRGWAGGGTEAEGGYLGLRAGDPLPGNEIVVMGNNAPGNFKLRPGVDSMPIGTVTVPGKSATIATDLSMGTEIPQMFGRPVKPGDILSGGFVSDIQAAGFEVVFAPTARNPLHVRIVAGAATFDETGIQWLNLATDRLGKAGNR